MGEGPLNDTRPSPTAPPGLASTKSLRSYPLTERDSLLGRDRVTRSRVCLRLRSAETSRTKSNEPPIAAGRSYASPVFSNAQKFREDRPERKPGSIVEGDTDARASVFTLAFCEAFAALARGTAYDRVGTRSNENEAFCSRQHHIRVTVAADKYEPCSGIAHGKIN